MWHGSGPGGGGGSGGGTWTTVFKTADTSRASSLGTTADPTLKFTCVNGVSYVVRGRVYFSTNTTADFLYNFANGDAVPVDASGFVRLSEPDLDGPGSVITGAAPWSEAIAADFTQGFLEFEFLIEDGFGGDFEFAWGQVVSDVGATVVKKGSYLEYAVLA